MKFEIKTSTIFVWIIAQTIISILFYLEDNFVSGLEAILTFILSIPFTVFIQWLRGEFYFTDQND